jgi:hypothetical protein
VDVTAPGSTILSTLRNGGYGYMSGTSMASPVVAGAAGLAFSGLAGATNATVRAAVEAAVADLGAPGKDTTFGFGRTDTALFFGGGGGGGGGTPAAPSVTTSTLPGGTVGTSYSASLAASGGTAPYTWSLSSGTLPNGLTLSSGGALGGTPTAAGTSSFTVRVTDANGQIGTRALSIAVTAPPSTPGTADLTGSWTKAKKGTGKVKGDYSLVVSGASASGVVVRFQLFANGFLVSQQDRHLGTLTPGTRLIEIEFIGTWPGTLTVRAIVDPSGAIAESNELNNQADRAVQN